MQVNRMNEFPSSNNVRRPYFSIANPQTMHATNFESDTTETEKANQINLFENKIHFINCHEIITSLALPNQVICEPFISSSASLSLSCRARTAENPAIFPRPIKVKNDELNHKH